MDKLRAECTTFRNCHEQHTTINNEAVDQERHAQEQGSPIDYLKPQQRCIRTGTVCRICEKDFEDPPALVWPVALHLRILLGGRTFHDPDRACLWRCGLWNYQSSLWVVVRFDFILPCEFDFRHPYSYTKLQRYVAV
jgi:hypothetical protein